jgi:hypothetical protein
MTKPTLTERFFGSRRRGRVSIFLLSLITACILVHSFDQMRPGPIDELYQKIDRLDLDHSQRIALRAIRNLFVEEVALEEHPVETSDFLLSISGILTEEQFRSISGQPKDERQKLRYELRQIRADMALQGEGNLRSHR